MGKEFASWSLLLHLLFLMCSHGNGAREISEKHSLQESMVQNNVLRLHSMRDGNGHQMMHTRPSSRMHHMEPQFKKFFTVKDLKVGKITKVSLQKLDPNPSQFLPREIAESIPFSSKNLHHILKLLSVPQHSSLAREMEETLLTCESKPIIGEIKRCVTSLESMLDFVHSILGAETHFHPIMTRLLTESKTVNQNYTICKMPKELPVSQMVPCHPSTYPYAVFVCHSVERSKVFRVPLEGDNGNRIDALVACHFHTSDWDPNLEAFRILGKKPGETEVCHFLPVDHLMWVAQETRSREMNESRSLKELIMARNDDQNNALRLHVKEDDNDKHIAKQENGGVHDHQMMHSERVHANPSSHMHNMDPVLSIFFTMKDLKFGKTMPLYFKKLDPDTSKFLPKEIAQSIPFSSEELPHLLKLLSLSKGSRLARDMVRTLGTCEAKPIKGETKFCATSLESLLDSVHSIFGAASNFRALTTQLITESKTNIYQNYTIRKEPKELTTSQIIPCHPFSYPYAVFFCHHAEHTKTFKVSLEGENGDRIEALAACHMETSEWDPHHVSFQVLGTKPGSSEVCHFFPASNLVWVPRKNV